VTDRDPNKEFSGRVGCCLAAFLVLVLDAFGLVGIVLLLTRS
jgi:hypothetical protein